MNKKREKSKSSSVETSRGKSKRKGKSEENKSNTDTKLSRKEYETELERLHGELVKLQYWVKEQGERAVVVFEGRDAAGKGGIIKRITERVSPRVFRVVALPAPSEREKSELYVQRYLSHFPAAGEIVLFDRSWYNRAGVERVMGFCSNDEYERFLRNAPVFERMIVESGVKLIKYWLEVSMEEQERRFKERINDQRKTWKLSPMDVESYRRWYEYSRARDDMLQATDTDFAPWHIVRSENKRRARLNCISHLLDQFLYEAPEDPRVQLGKRNHKEKYDDKASMEVRRFIPEKY